MISISRDNYLIKDVGHGFLISVSYTGLKPLRNGPNISEHAPLTLRTVLPVF